jgi:hypothetical protein
MCTQWARFGPCLPTQRRIQTAIPSSMFFVLGSFWSGRLWRLLSCPPLTATNALQQNGFRLSDRWRIYGFPSIVAAIYLTLNVISFITDEIWRWSQLSLWSCYALVLLHCFAVYASWIVYVAGTDRLVARSLTSIRAENAAGEIPNSKSCVNSGLGSWNTNARGLWSALAVGMNVVFQSTSGHWIRRSTRAYSTTSRLRSTCRTRRGAGS